MRFSVEVDNYNPHALTHCLKRLEDEIPDFEYNWSLRVNAGGIDYGIFLNFDLAYKEIEICNQGDGDDMLDDVIKAINDLD